MLCLKYYCLFLDSNYITTPTAATPTHPQLERRNVSPTRSQLMHIVYLKRFIPSSDILSSEESLQEHFCNLLEAAPHKALSLRTLSEKIVSLNAVDAECVCVCVRYVHMPKMAHF